MRTTGVVFREILRATSEDILCINLTSKFSASHNCANLAAGELMAEFEGRSITVVDSRMVTGLQGKFVLDAAKLRDAGKSAPETAEILTAHYEDVKAYITVDSLVYLQRGGRIGKAAALAGGLLNIKPILSFSDGELHPNSKARGRKAAVNEILKLTFAEPCNVDDYEFFVINSACADEAKALCGRLADEHGVKGEIAIYDLGVTIGAHIGPSVLAVAKIKKLVI
jgi:DegV family protein with EDD domain